MSYISSNYDNNPAAPMGTWVGVGDYYGQCVSYVKAVVPTLGRTATWTKGALVKGNLHLAKGTVIATFNTSGNYHGHAAIYESQTQQGLYVVDQWVTPPATPIHRRLIQLGGNGSVNNGNNFYVVE